MKKASVLKILALVLAVAMIGSLFAACGSSGQNQSSAGQATTQSQAATAGESSSSEAASPIDQELAKGDVNLTMYLVCDPQKDQSVVWDEVNKKLQQDIKTTVTIKNIPWADFLQKYQLIFASGEEFDCAFAGNFCNYSTLASKNAFMPLTEDMIKTYAPKTWTDMDPGFLKGSMVGGKIYMVPANQHDVRGSLAAVRGDLVKKYNLTVSNLDEFYNYLTTVAKNEKIVAFSNDPDNTSWYDETYGRYNAISDINVKGNNVNTFDENPKVFNMFETDTFLQYALKMRELNQAGVFPKSMLSSKEKSGDMFPAGTVASHLDTWTGVYQIAQKAKDANPSWDPQIVDLTNYNNPLSDLSPSDAGLVLNPRTQHPERVLMMLDLLREDQSYQDLTYLGIEGTHWTAPSDNTFKETETGSASFQYNANCPWAWGNSNIMRVDSSVPQNIIDIRSKWLGIKKDSVAVAFKFDDTNVKSEEAAISNVLAKYFNLLIYGYAPDTKGTIAKLNAGLKAAGLEKVQQETQKQLDAFVAQYGK